MKYIILFLIFFASVCNAEVRTFNAYKVFQKDRGEKDWKLPKTSNTKIIVDTDKEIITLIENDYETVYHIQTFSIKNTQDGEQMIIFNTKVNNVSCGIRIVFMDNDIIQIYFNYYPYTLCYLCK